MSVGVGGITSTCISSTFSSLLGDSAIVDDCEGRRDPPPISPIVVIVEAKLPDWSLRSDLGWLGCRGHVGEQNASAASEYSVRFSIPVFSGSRTRRGWGSREEHHDFCCLAVGRTRSRNLVISTLHFRRSCTRKCDGRAEGAWLNC
jgi:hypothetical protein